MKSPKRVLVYEWCEARVEPQTRLLRELAKIEAYVGQSNPRRGRKFVSEVFDLISDIIESNPYAFPEDSNRRTPTHEFRRAVFRSDYLILYRVTDDSLEFLTIFHTSRNPDSLPLK